MGLKYEEVTKDIIGAAFEVYKVLGYGFLEKVCQKSMRLYNRHSVFCGSIFSFSNLVAAMPR